MAPDTPRLRIVTWNVNSVRLRLDAVIALIEAEAPDILCLQEIKVETDRFPLQPFADRGYGHAHIVGMKAYHGVAILSRRRIEPRPQPDWVGMGDARHAWVHLPGTGLPGTNGGIDLHNFYVPAGGPVPDREQNAKFDHKLRFVDAMTDWFAGPPGDRPAILVGDLNIAPLEQDVWSHRQLLSVVSHTPVEVAALGRLQAGRGWVDALRRFVPPDRKLYSWWSYRARDWSASDRGRRLDHVWVTPDLAPALADGRVLRAVRGWETPSDHVPVIVDLAIPG